MRTRLEDGVGTSAVCASGPFPFLHRARWNIHTPLGQALQWVAEGCCASMECLLWLAVYGRECEGVLQCQAQLAPVYKGMTTARM